MTLIKEKSLSIMVLSPGQITQLYVLEKFKSSLTFIYYRTQESIRGVLHLYRHFYFDYVKNNFAWEKAKKEKF